MPIDARHPKESRADIRRGKLAGVTAGLAGAGLGPRQSRHPAEGQYLLITHSPGHMFITDLPNHALAAF